MITEIPRLTTRWNPWLTCRYFAALSPLSPGCAALLGWHRRLWSIITSHSQCRVTSAPHFSTGCLLIRRSRELWSSCVIITSTSYACVPNMEQRYFRFSSVRGCLNMPLYQKFCPKIQCESLVQDDSLSWNLKTWWHIMFIFGVKAPSDIRQKNICFILVCSSHEITTINMRRCLYRMSGFRLHLNKPPATHPFIFPQSGEMAVNVDDCFQVIFGVTSSVSPTYWCYHMSHQSQKCRPCSWFLLAVWQFHDDLVARRMLCRNSWSWAKLWKPQIHKWGRVGLTSHILCSLDLIKSCFNSHECLCQV